MSITRVKIRKAKITTLDLTETATPEEALFQCALHISRVSKECVLCIIRDMNEYVEELFENGQVSHSMNPDDFQKDVRVDVERPN
jgi:hypothetical protein